MQTKAATRHPRSRLGDAYELGEAFQAGRLLPDVIAALQRVENPVGVIKCESEVTNGPDGEIRVLLEIGLTL